MDEIAGAQEQFCREQYARLVGSLALYTGDREVAEDLAHEALARALTAWPRVAAARSPGAYVQRIAFNLAHRHFRRASQPVKHPPREGAADAIANIPLRVDLHRAVAQLPRRQREALLLRYVADLSIKDAAAVLRCRPGTVQSLCHQGLTSLRSSALLADRNER